MGIFDVQVFQRRSLDLGGQIGLHSRMGQESFPVALVVPRHGETLTKVFNYAYSNRFWALFWNATAEMIF